MSRRKGKPKRDEQRHLEKAISTGNVKALRVVLDTGEITISADLLAQVFDTASISILEALIDAGAPCEQLLQARFRSLASRVVFRRDRTAELPPKLKLLIARANLNKLTPPPVWQFLDDPHLLSVVLAHGADPDAVSPQEGTTPLLAALGRSHLETESIRLLITAGADVRARDYSKTGRFGRPRMPHAANALHRSCHYALPLHIVRCILDTGRADLNATVGGVTALTITVERSTAEQRHATASLLLEAGADPNAGSPTPLERALAQGRSDLAQLLLRHGATALAAYIHTLPQRRDRLGPQTFELVCLLRAFGAQITLDQIRASCGPTQDGYWREWSDAETERAARSALTDFVPHTRL